MKRHNWQQVNEHQGRIFVNAVCAKCGCKEERKQVGEGGRMGLGKVTWIEQYELDGVVTTKRPSCK